jgi:DNA invertase Pin-like site-specific DNA recombinase
MDHFSSLLNARGYCRVSTTLQSSEGVSLETQMKTIQQYCDFKGYNCIKIYTDAGISGASMDRPQLQLLVSEIQPNEFFIVYDLSRFSRNTLEAMSMVKYFQDRNIHFVSIKNDMDLSSPMGRCMFRMLMSFYELERDNIAANVKANMQRLSAEGKLRTKAPFGWRFVGKDKDMVPDPEQQLVISKIIAMYNTSTSFNQIAQILNLSGDNRFLNNNKKTPSSNPVFYSNTIKRILIDQGIISSSNPKRKPLNQRLVSYHKSSSAVSGEPQHGAGQANNHLDVLFQESVEQIKMQFAFCDSQLDKCSSEMNPQPVGNIVRFEDPGPILEIVTL